MGGRGERSGVAPGEAQAEAGDREAEPFTAWLPGFTGFGLHRGAPLRRDVAEAGVVGAGAGIALHALDDASGNPGMHRDLPVVVFPLVTTKSMTLVASPVKCDDW